MDKRAAHWIIIGTKWSLSNMIRFIFLLGITNSMAGKLCLSIGTKQSESLELSSSRKSKIVMISKITKNADSLKE